MTIALIIYFFVNTTIAGGYFMDAVFAKPSFKNMASWLVLVAIGGPYVLCITLWEYLKNTKVVREILFRVSLWRGKFKNGTPAHINQLERFFGDESKADEMAKRHWRIVKEKYGYVPILTRAERRKAKRRVR